MMASKDQVTAKAHTVTFDTYTVGAPEQAPMFLETRVYQGSSGRVYPLPFYSSVSTTKIPKSYEALSLANKYVELMILPEIGGRIHIGYDKVSNYDFFYRQEVIKPALVGLAGPWISGGVEFNWPQHHRPSTYMPCEWCLEVEEDGSKIYWLSEHEPMNRMKGMHGLKLRPDSSLIELKTRLYNRTPQTQTFLWWANVAARVHEFYQSFFPKDVASVADHAKRATSSFPACETSYYGVAYGERPSNGVPENEVPNHFNPLAGVDPNRLDWYANIPVPTSYMVTATNFEFFGGYDHQAEAGFIHVADRTISPGKKQWTWGNHEFGYAWDRNLTDEGGPYVELMAGVYTDNQPDFSFIAPYETKVFSQFWYPIRKIGPAANATRHAALSVEGNRVGICPSAPIAGALLTVRYGDQTREETVTLSLEDPLMRIYDSEVLSASLVSVDGVELVSFDFSTLSAQPAPVQAQEPKLPSEVESVSELHRIAVHLDQYRHATRAPEDYWYEALRRDPEHVESHVCLGKRALQRGLWVEAKNRFKSAIELQTKLNPNPNSGDAYYLLGVTEELCGEYRSAYNHFGKAAWNYATKGASHMAMARIAMREGKYDHALSLLSTAKLSLGDANDLHCMEAHCHRKLGGPAKSKDVLDSLLKVDPLDHWALYELHMLPDSTPDDITRRYNTAVLENFQARLDVAINLEEVGAELEARELIGQVADIDPMAKVFLGERCPQPAKLADLFPNRLQELRKLESHVEHFPDDAVALMLLGNFYYDRRRHLEGIACWEKAVEANPSLAVAWRNLGIGKFNIQGDATASMTCYEAAMEADPREARFLYERDQLDKRLGTAATERLARLEAKPDLISMRDDLTLEYATLLNITGNPRRAVQVLSSKTFTPWEGGEGIALGAWARAQELLSREAEASEQKLQHILAAINPPENLGESRHALANASNLWYQAATHYAALGDHAVAQSYYERAANFKGDFQEMSVLQHSELSYFQARSLQALGRSGEAETMLLALKDYAIQLRTMTAKIDYFATSLPTMLLFKDNLQARQNKSADLMLAQAYTGLGNFESAQLALNLALAYDPYCPFALDLAQELS
jgi:tetratricopeptide (TPR) repeat protein